MKSISRRKFIKGLGYAAISLPVMSFSNKVFGSSEKWANTVPQIDKPLNQQTITYYNWGDFSGDPATVANIKAFTEQTGIKVNGIQIPVKNIQAKMTTALAAKSSEIDIVEMLDEQIMDYIHRGWLEPLDDYISSEEIAGWAPAAREACIYDKNDVKAFGPISYKGEVYATPWIGESIILFYNKEHLKQSGLEKPPTHFSEFVNVAVKIKNEGITQNPIIFPYSTYDTGFQVTRNFVLRSGGKFFDGMNPQFLNDRVVEGFTFLSELFTKHKVVSPTVINVDEGDASARFLRGQATFLINETATAEMLLKELGSKQAVEEKFGAAILPNPDGIGFLDTPTQELKLLAAGVSVYSKRKRAAAEFAKFFQSKASLKNELLLEWDMPLRPEVWEIPEVQEKVPFADVFRQATAGSSREIVPHQAEIMQQFWQISMNAFLGNKTPKEVLEEGQKLAKKTLSK